MARKQFTISYPDGSKKHIGATERQQMELREELQQIGPTTFVFTGIYVPATFKCKDLSGLSALVPVIEERIADKRKFLPGQFVVEYPERLGGARERQAEERPEAFVQRLRMMGMPATGFAEAVA